MYRPFHLQIFPLYNIVWHFNKLENILKNHWFSMHYLNFFPALFQLLTLSCYCLLPLFLIPQSPIVLLYLLSFNFLSSREYFSYQNNVTWGHWNWANVAFGQEMAEAPLGARTTFNDFPQGQRLLFFYVFLSFPTRMQTLKTLYMETGLYLLWCFLIFGINYVF